MSKQPTYEELEGQLRQLKLRLSVLEPITNKLEEDNKSLKEDLQQKQGLLETYAEQKRIRSEADHDPAVLTFFENASTYVDKEDPEFVFSLVDAARAIARMDPRHRDTDLLLTKDFYQMAAALASPYSKDLPDKDHYLKYLRCAINRVKTGLP